MLYLLISIFTSALIGNLLYIFKRDAQIKILQIFLGNYFLAAIFSAIMNDTPLQKIGSFEILWGMLTGFFFLVNFLCYQKNIRVNGLSLSVGTMRTSLIIPIFFALVVFKEEIFLVNYLGIAIIIIAFAIVTETKKFHSLLWLALLFFLTGMGESSIKFYEVYGLAQKGSYLFFLFSSAFIFNLIWIAAEKQKIHWKSLAYGLVLGIPNMLTSKYLLYALEEIPATIVFPLAASSVVILTILSDIFIWKKEFGRKKKISFALIVIGIFLINLHI
ncbi:MAG: EamA family transporter [Candidatus Cloacimonadales bacterium]